ncbi:MULTISPECIES: autotransporter outer membrane beta-barrel domain-containing protein [unclassified Pseudomonas]|uniref:autotransporter outer membrane beta-barrel domain-containing protein n=1 Tax=unclassified Pseudomonas TaxID=196821 RepID=UPI00069FB663|nr:MULTISPECIES: autotransporter outer membrane beta-barrel domain-containing protein [unclassified Pseudomonas]WPN49350.1 autotransporter outer membrane beta-barrel domain-containing protein [Pseudomonas sp. P8_241]
MNIGINTSQKPAFAGPFQMLVAIPAFFILSPAVLAATIVDNTTLDIDATTPAIDYLVRNEGVLNVTGASTREITATSGSTLNINGATITARDGIEGITITNSRGTLNQANVTSDTLALAVNRLSSSTQGSTVTATGGFYRGGEAGAQVTGMSTLTLINTEITGTGVNSVGLSILGGDVRATADTRISGDRAGVRMARDPSALGNNSLTLDNATVEGRNGAAIVVDTGISAKIDVLNNSTLQGKDNQLLLVQGASTANMTVANSTLKGNVNATGGSTANLTFDAGHMVGDVVKVDDASTTSVTLQNGSTLTGRLDKANGVTINSGSSWTLAGNDSVGTLAMNDGRVNFGAAGAPATYYQLNVGTLAGTGVFAMKGDFANGDHDFLNVTGVATGNFGLAVTASGLDAVSPQALTLVHTAAGDANFALQGGAVDLGTWSYELTRRSFENGETEWFLDPTTKTISPGAASVLALFYAPITIAYAEDASLRSRMGELRFNGGKTGFWMRGYGNKYNVSSGSGLAYKQTQQGLSLGADARLGDSQWLAGVMTGYSDSDLNVEQGTSGTINSYYLGPYVSWLDAASGYYFDATLKFNRYHNDAKVSMSDGTRAKGDYRSSGISASAEFGRHIALDQGYFVEPYAKLSTAVIKGQDYDLDNGMNADGDRARSVLGEAGATAGRTFDMDNGMKAQPYVRAALQQEFINNNRVTVNHDNQFNNDLSGSRGVLGAGIALAVTKDLQVHADVDYSKGEHIEKPYGLNLGVRWAF